MEHLFDKVHEGDRRAVRARAGSRERGVLCRRSGASPDGRQARRLERGRTWAPRPV